MTGLLLQVLGILTTGLVYPNYQWWNSILNNLQTEQQQIVQVQQEEQARNYRAEQKEIVIEDYFTFAKKLGKLNYARWCAGKYTDCWSKSFDCGWVMKAYLVAKWIISKSELLQWLYNSLTLYELWKKKDPRTAKRWDFMYRRWYGANQSWNLSTHFSIVARDYTGWNTLWIFDNVVPGWQDKYNERPIKLTCNSTMCHYLGKYRIYIASNWAFEKANERGVEVQPWVDVSPKPMMSIVKTGNSVSIKWYTENSLANKIASYWYDNIENKSEALDMIGTMMQEAMFNINAIWSKWEVGICQLLPMYNKVFINNPKWLTPMWQAELCLTKRKLVKKPYILRHWWKNKNTQIKKIILYK